MTAAPRIVTGYDPSRQITGCIPQRRERELCGNAGARQLAAELTAWWHARGFPQVTHWVEELPLRTRVGAVFAVRSNLVNGCPPRVRPTPPPDMPIADAPGQSTRQEGEGAATPLATPTPKAPSKPPAMFLDGVAVGQWLRTREAPKDA